MRIWKRMTSDSSSRHFGSRPRTTAVKIQISRQKHLKRWRELSNWNGQVTPFRRKTGWRKAPKLRDTLSPQPRSRNQISITTADSPSQYSPIAITVNLVNSFKIPVIPSKQVQPIFLFSFFVKLKDVSAAQCTHTNLMNFRKYFNILEITLDCLVTPYLMGNCMNEHKKI